MAHIPILGFLLENSLNLALLLLSRMVANSILEWLALYGGILEILFIFVPPILIFAAAWYFLKGRRDELNREANAPWVCTACFYEGPVAKKKPGHVMISFILW